MTDKVKELTDLSKESMKARANLDRILDFVDLINKRAEEIEGDVAAPALSLRFRAGAARRPALPPRPSWPTTWMYTPWPASAKT